MFLSNSMCVCFNFWSVSNQVEVQNVHVSAIVHVSQLSHNASVSQVMMQFRLCICLKSGSRSELVCVSSLTTCMHLQQ